MQFTNRLAYAPCPQRIELPYEKFAFRTLKPNGLLYALFMQTRGAGGPPYHCDVKEMQSLFSEKRWYWGSQQPFRSDHPLGVHELGFVLRRK
jgi:methyl halide transferase